MESYCQGLKGQRFSQCHLESLAAAEDAVFGEGWRAAEGKYVHQSRGYRLYYRLDDLITAHTEVSAARGTGCHNKDIAPPPLPTTLNLVPLEKGFGCRKPCVSARLWRCMLVQMARCRELTLAAQNCTCCVSENSPRGDLQLGLASARTREMRWGTATFISGLARMQCVRKARDVRG